MSCIGLREIRGWKGIHVLLGGSHWFTSLASVGVGEWSLVMYTSVIEVWSADLVGVSVNLSMDTVLFILSSSMIMLSTLETIILFGPVDLGMSFYLRV